MQAVHIEKLIMKAEEDRLLLLKEADAQLPLSSGAQVSSSARSLFCILAKSLQSVNL